MNIEIPPFRRKQYWFTCPQCKQRTVKRTGCGYCDECIWKAFAAFREAMRWPIDRETRDEWLAWHIVTVSLRSLMSENR